MGLLISFAGRLCNKNFTPTINKITNSCKTVHKIASTGGYVVFGEKDTITSLAFCEGFLPFLKRKEIRTLLLQNFISQELTTNPQHIAQCFIIRCDKGEDTDGECSFKELCITYIDDCHVETFVRTDSASGNNIEYKGIHKIRSIKLGRYIESWITEFVEEVERQWRNNKLKAILYIVREIVGLICIFKFLFDIIKDYFQNKIIW